MENAIQNARWEEYERVYHTGKREAIASKFVLLALIPGRAVSCSARRRQVGRKGQCSPWILGCGIDKKTLEIQISPPRHKKRGE